MKRSRIRALGAPLGALAMSLALVAAPGTAHAGIMDKPKVLSGPSPFATCTADDAPGESYTLNAESETTIAVHPLIPTFMAIAWRQDHWATGSSRGIVVASTRNGGVTWHKTVLPGVSACSGGEGRATNPWLHYSADGTLYASVTGFAADRSTIMVSRSADGGRTWSAPAVLTSDEMPRFWNDKQALVTDPRDPRRVYVVWNRRDRDQDVHDVMLARSEDGGRTWRPAESIHRPSTPGAGTIGNQIAVLPNGHLVNVFVENEHPIGGEPWPPNLPERIRVMRSEDRGKTWSEPITVADAVINQPLLPDTPWIPVMAPGNVPDIAVDRRTGVLYVVWGDMTLSGSLSAIALSTSSDGGRTWSAPRKINLTPDSPAFGNGQAFLPQVEVTATGAVGVSYYDFRNNTPEAGTTTDVWLATCDRQCSTPQAKWKERHIAGPFDFEKAPMWFGGPYVGSFAGLAHALNSFIVAPVVTTSEPGNPTDVVAVRSRL